MEKTNKPVAQTNGLRPSENALANPRQVVIFPFLLTGKKGKAYQVTVGSENGKGITINRAAPRPPKLIKEANQKELQFIKEKLGLTNLVDG